MSQEALSSPAFKSSSKGLPCLTTTVTLGLAPEFCPAHLYEKSGPYYVQSYYSTLIAALTSNDLVRNQAWFVSLLSVATFKMHHASSFPL